MPSSKSLSKKDLLSFYKQLTSAEQTIIRFLSVNYVSMTRSALVNGLRNFLVNPDDEKHDAVVRLWVRESERELLEILTSTMRSWLAADWPFSAVRFENIG